MVNDVEDYFDDDEPPSRKRIKSKRKFRRVECTCATEDFCFVHPTDTDSLDPHGPWGPP